MRTRIATTAFLLLVGFLQGAVPPAVEGQTCPVQLSQFAEDTVQNLHDRFCDEAQSGWSHGNLPETDPVQLEKDEIFMLLSFALVAEKWELSRGHQIAAVLVDPVADEVLWVDFNSNFVNNSPIDHAEARAVRNYVQYLNDQGTSTPYWDLLDGTTLYASLEPCQMCAGTINMSRIDRVVFGMEDPGFGDALDYLHAFPYHANFEFQSGTSTAQALIDEVAQNPASSLTSIIADSRYAFDLAIDDLEAFVPAHPENQQALDNALATLQLYAVAPPPVPDGTFGAPMTSDRMAPDGSEIGVTWDVTSCPALDYALLYGPLAGVDDLAVSGAACGLGGTGTFDWQTVPTADAWFLVVAGRGEVEGSWGTDGAAAQRNGAVASGRCGNPLRDNAIVCP